MLREIICDKFKQKRVIFHNGLNTILGDDIGSNSIGKTTFLLMIDFVFGGKSFLDAKEVFKQIGQLEVKSLFKNFIYNHFSIRLINARYTMLFAATTVLS